MLDLGVPGHLEAGTPRVRRREIPLIVEPPPLPLHLDNLAPTRAFFPLLALLLALLVLPPATAVAADAQRAVIDLDESRRRDDTTNLLTDAFGARFEATILDLDELLDVPADGWLAVPPAELTNCPANDLTPEAIEAELAAVEERMAMLEWVDAEVRLLELENNLCGAAEPIPPTAASRIAYLLGIVRYYTGDHDGAREAFRQAVERTREKVEWDTAYPPEAQQTFLLGLGDAAYSPKAYLHLPADHVLQALYIDGEEAPLSGAPQVVGAQHVVQLKDQDGSVRGATLDCSEAAKVQLLTLDSMRSALRGDGGDGDVLQGTLDTLATAAVGQGFVELVVLSKDGSTARWFTSGINDWKTAALARGRRVVKTGSPSANPNAVGGIVLLGSGVGLLGGGLVGAIANKAEMDELRPQMEAKAAVWDANIDHYRDLKARAGIGVGLAAAGAVATGIGVPLLVKGVQQGNGEQAQVVPAWTGTWLGVCGTW